MATPRTLQRDPLTGTLYRKTAALFPFNRTMPRSADGNSRCCCDTPTRCDSPTECVRCPAGTPNAYSLFWNGLSTMGGDECIPCVSDDHQNMVTGGPSFDSASEPCTRYPAMYTGLSPDGSAASVSNVYSDPSGSDTCFFRGAFPLYYYEHINAAHDFPPKVCEDQSDCWDPIVTPFETVVYLDTDGRLKVFARSLLISLDVPAHMIAFYGESGVIGDCYDDFPITITNQVTTAQNDTDWCAGWDNASALFPGFLGLAANYPAELYQIAAWGGHVTVYPCTLTAEPETDI